MRPPHRSRCAHTRTSLGESLVATLLNPAEQLAAFHAAREGDCKQGGGEPGVSCPSPNYRPRALRPFPWGTGTVRLPRLDSLEGGGLSAWVGWTELSELREGGGPRFSPESPCISGGTAQTQLRPRQPRYAEIFRHTLHGSCRDAEKLTAAPGHTAAGWLSQGLNPKSDSRAANL